MQRIRRLFGKKQDRFLELLIQQAEYAVEANEMLLKYLEKPGEKFSTRTRQIEKDADEVRRILVERRAFSRDSTHMLGRLHVPQRRPGKTRNLEHDFGSNDQSPRRTRLELALDILHW